MKSNIQKTSDDYLKDYRSVQEAINGFGVTLSFITAQGYINR